MKEVYHCSPKDIEEIDEWRLQLDFDFLMAERHHEYMEAKRREQKTKVLKSN